MYCIIYGQCIYQKAFLNHYVDIYLFSIFFYRSFPLENDFVNIYRFSIFSIDFTQ